MKALYQVVNKEKFFQSPGQAVSHRCFHSIYTPEADIGIGYQSPQIQTYLVSPMPSPEKTAA